LFIDVVYDMGGGARSEGSIGAVECDSASVIASPSTQYWWKCAGYNRKVYKVKQVNVNAIAAT